ncbi:helix-turn-helix domain-containing protein [Bacillus cereus group sp. MYBK227-1]|uniref:helix-turn-helix domain-containing protein n=1 Tax=Bacillus cereus group sp. MYBK227-1 TaxID=3450654 RepID=UPI003F7B135C
MLPVIKNVLTENKINQNKLVEMLKVISPSTANKMCKGSIKRSNIKTLAKVANHFEIDATRELSEIIKRKKLNEGFFFFEEFYFLI